MKVPLLDYLQWKMGCAYLSDLHWLSGGQRMRLAREIERIEAPEASLHEWNDALEYLLGRGPEPTAEAARAALIAALRGQDEQKGGDHGGIQAGNRTAAAADAGGAVPAGQRS